jgi:tRNA (guanine-N7-)-methyltransferase
MARIKLQQFAEMKALSNVFEERTEWAPSTFKGKWSQHFGNNNPIILELACGRGDYTLGLAQRFPDQNFIGIDVKGARMYYGAKKALELGLSNVAFLRIQIEDLLTYFDKDELSEIWIIFADPHPRKGSARKRLTFPRFLKMYVALLQTGGKLHLKTDHEGLFEYSVETVDGMKDWTLNEVIRDVYKHSEDPVLIEIQTTYEKRHLAEGRTIYYMNAVLG